jgi:hypothetical protein
MRTTARKVESCEPRTGGGCCQHHYHRLQGRETSRAYPVGGPRVVSGVIVRSNECNDFIQCELRMGGDCDYIDGLRGRKNLLREPYRRAAGGECKECKEGKETLDTVRTAHGRRLWTRSTSLTTRSRNLLRVPCRRAAGGECKEREREQQKQCESQMGGSCMDSGYSHLNINIVLYIYFSRIV